MTLRAPVGASKKGDSEQKHIDIDLSNTEGQTTRANKTNWKGFEVFLNDWKGLKMHRVSSNKSFYDPFDLNAPISIHFGEFPNFNNTD